MTFDSTDGLEEISRQLVNGLPKELRDQPDSAWTAAIVKGLDKIGKSKGLHVCGHGCSGQSEWMLDIVWMKTPEQRVILAVESEWRGQSAISEDFGKLMVVKSPLKLMVFNTSDHKGWELIVKRLEKDMTNFPDHLSGEHYLLLEVTAPGAFRYEFRVPTDGRLDPVQFQELERLDWPWRV